MVLLLFLVTLLYTKEIENQEIKHNGEKISSHYSSRRERAMGKPTGSGPNSYVHSISKGKYVYDKEREEKEKREKNKI